MIGVSTSEVNQTLFILSDVDKRWRSCNQHRDKDRESEFFYGTLWIHIWL